MKTILPGWLLFTLCCCQTFAAEEHSNDSQSLTEQLEAAAAKAEGQKYRLRYKFTKGEEIRCRVTHRVTVDTTIESVRQRAHTRSISTKVWKVGRIDAAGNITFVHMISDADMWQKVEGREEVRYNSQTDQSPPRVYEAVADSIGVPLAEVTIDPFGQVTKRVDKTKGHGWGGQLMVPLPPEAVAIGERWYKPQEIVVRHKDGRVRTLKTRQQYQLKSVAGDIAEIQVDTQVLTPLRDPKLKVQIVQRLTHGNIKFDISQGRIVSQKLHFDETVIGFNGPKSIMNYVGRLSEQLLGAGPQQAQTARN